MSSISTECDKNVIVLRTQNTRITYDINEYKIMLSPNDAV